jgi:hypothetical protein
MPPERFRTWVSTVLVVGVSISAALIAIGFRLAPTSLVRPAIVVSPSTSARIEYSSEAVDSVVWPRLDSR